MSTVFFAIAIVAGLVAMYARSQQETLMEDPYVAWSVGVIDKGQQHDVPIEQLQVVPNNDEQVQEYLAAHGAAHPYYIKGNPKWAAGEATNRYRTTLTIEGQPKVIFSQPYINNEAGMHLNLRGNKVIEVYVAQNGDVYFLC